jgi:hypothetical protein
MHSLIGSLDDEMSVLDRVMVSIGLPDRWFGGSTGPRLAIQPRLGEAAGARSGGGGPPGSTLAVALTWGAATVRTPGFRR